MNSLEIHVGDHVGVKDSPEFIHWSATGTVASVAFGPDGKPASFGVTLDKADRAAAAGAVPMLPGLLVRLCAPGERDPSGDWTARAYPTNGDAPGPLMYFASGRDLLFFAHQFQALQLDEVLRVHVPPSATEADRHAIRLAGCQDA